MKQFEYRINEYQVTCGFTEDEQGIVICSVRGTGSAIEFPEIIEGTNLSVKVVGKKAFLGLRSLRSVILPDSITEIGDWAFAQCEQLQTVFLGNPGKDGDLLKNREANPVTLGVGVFEDCKKLQEIYVGRNSSKDLAVLLGATVRLLSAEDLLRDGELGTEHWYQKWDQRLSAYLQEENTEGYTNVVLCGEEGLRKSQGEYVEEKQRKKAFLCMLRLLHPEQLGDKGRETYVEYLLCHTKGCSNEAAWEVLLREHGDELSYYELLMDIGAINEKNVDAMMLDLKDQHAEAKAFLIRYKQECTAGADVFAMFEL